MIWVWFSLERASKYKNGAIYTWRDELASNIEFQGLLGSVGYGWSHFLQK
jgi:hypothetical protein